MRGIGLATDEIIVGTPTDPVAQKIGEFYELHQNQLGSKWDPEKMASNMVLFESGLTVFKANDLFQGRVMCINFFTQTINAFLNIFHTHKTTYVFGVEPLVVLIYMLLFFLLNAK